MGERDRHYHLSLPSLPLRSLLSFALKALSVFSYDEWRGMRVLFYLFDLVLFFFLRCASFLFAVFGRNHYLLLLQLRTLTPYF